MIPVLSVAQMRNVDERAIGGNFTIGYSYMLKAGMGLFRAAKEQIPDTSTGEIAIICGKGNNGGDGYVAGRMLLDAGYKIMCFSLVDIDELRGESKLAFDEYCAQKGNVLVLNDVDDLQNLSRFKLIIDAMLGTGLRGDPRGFCAAVIEMVNNSGVPVLAVDTPSGLNNDTGIPGSPCIRAHVTVTMGFPKLGLFFYPGKALTGRLIIQDLGYPDDIIAEEKPGVFLPEISDLERFVPPRYPDGSKIEHGLAFLICGSRGMTGSATLVSQAALRTGCGMTHLAAPESIIPILSIKTTETVLHPLEETESGTLSFGACDQIKELARCKDALCIGPGISHETQTSLLAREIVKTLSIPMVLDADGINAFKDTVRELVGHAGELVITPHRGEWQRLFGELPAEPAKRIESVAEKARDYNMVILLKGNPTIIAEPSGNAFILPFGNSALSSAGTGDVLSGIIVSLLAQGAPVLAASILGGFIQQEAGTIASRKFGEHSVIASDVVDTIYRVITLLQKKRKFDYTEHSD